MKTKRVWHSIADTTADSNETKINAGEVYQELNRKLTK